MPLAGIGGSRNFAQEKAKLGFQKSWRDVCQKILRWCPSKRLLRSDATFPWIFLVVCLEEEAYLRLSILRQQLWIYDRDERMNLSLYGVYRRAVRYRDLAQGLTFWRKVLNQPAVACEKLVLVRVALGASAPALLFLLALAVFSSDGANRVGLLFFKRLDNP